MTALSSRVVAAVEAGFEESVRLRFIQIANGVTDGGQGPGDNGVAVAAGRFRESLDSLSAFRKTALEVARQVFKD